MQGLEHFKLNFNNSQCDALILAVANVQPITKVMRFLCFDGNQIVKNTLIFYKKGFDCEP